jgi:hypothetical protein
VRPTWLSIVLLLAAVAGVHGQQRPGVEVRGGVAVPLGDLREGLVPGTELAAGPSFAVSLMIPRRERSALLLGFGQHRLSCSGNGCEGAGALVSTAWSIGGRWALAAGESVPWVRVALLLDRSEGDFLEGDEAVRRASYLGLGGEAGVGFSWRLRESLTVAPGARLGAIETRFPRFGALSMRYVVVDLALTFAF